MATKTGSSFLDRLIERMDRLDPSSLQTYILRLSREKGFLETVFNTIREGIVVIDGNLRMQFVNAAARDLLGMGDDPAGQRMDRHLRDVDWSSVLKGDAGRWRAISRREIEVFYPAHRYLSFYLVPLEDRSPAGDHDRIPLAVVILRDVTENRASNEKALESQRVHAITLLAAGVAHEIGNPLNSLNIHLQLLRRCILRIEDDELSREAVDLLDVASGEVSRLHTIVSNFLHAIRPVPPDMKPVDLSKILAETLAFLRDEIEDRGISVEAILPDTLPPVAGDSDQLKQAFYNIIRNAVQAMPGGGNLGILCAERDAFVDIKFTDSGKGISREEMGRIMEPYFSTRSDGTGLGLLIVERIVRSHGGDLAIESMEGEGATFTISLPLRERRIRLLEAPDTVIDVAGRPES